MIDRASKAKLKAASSGTLYRPVPKGDGASMSAEPHAPAVLAKLPPAGTVDTDTILNAFLEVVAERSLEL